MRQVCCSFFMVLMGHMSSMNLNDLCTLIAVTVLSNQHLRYICSTCQYLVSSSSKANLLHNTQQFSERRFYFHDLITFGKLGYCRSSRVIISHEQFLYSCYVGFWVSIGCRKLPLGERLQVEEVGVDDECCLFVWAHVWEVSLLISGRNLGEWSFYAFAGAPIFC